MEVITINWPTLLIGLLLGGLIGAAAAAAYFLLGFSRKAKDVKASLEQAETEAGKMIGEAQKTGESRKRELLLQAKEEVIKDRN